MKIFCRMLLKRIKKRVKKGTDKNLQKEQAGFRPKRSKLNRSLYTLEEADEWRAGLYVDFVDFEKAYVMS